VKKIFKNVCNNGRDILINKLFSHFQLEYGLTIYNIATASPIDIVIGVLSLKLGLNKVAIMLILAFLL
jgi:hypothetical protein